MRSLPFITHTIHCILYSTVHVLSVCQIGMLNGIGFFL